MLDFPFPIPPEQLKILPPSPSRRETRKARSKVAEESN